MAAARIIDIFSRFANFVWFLFTWFLLVGVVCAAVAAFHFYHRVDEQIRAYAEQLIANQYPELIVRVESARLIEREGFRLENLSFKHRSAEGSDHALAHIEEVIVKCRPTLQDLMSGHVEVAEVVARQAIIRATRQRDGQWNTQGLARLPRLGGRSPPTIRLEDATVEIMDAQRQPTGFVVVRDVRMCVSPGRSDDSEDAPVQYQFEGSATGDHFQRVTLRGVFAPEKEAWRAMGQVSDLTVSPDLRSALPSECGRQLEPLGDLHAHCGLTFDVWRDPDASERIEYSANGTLTDGRLADPNLSLPLTDITASFELGTRKLRVDDVTGRFGEASIHLQCRRDGELDSSPIVVRGGVDRMRLDHHLIAGLPGEWQNWWKNMQPRGVASIDFEFTNSRGRWTPNVDIRCHDIAMEWSRFRYPVDSVEGTVHVGPEHVAFNLKSSNRRQPFRVRGRIAQPGEQWSGWFESRTDGPMPLDERFISALPDTAQKIARQLSLRGLVAFHCRHVRNASTDAVNHEVHVQLTRGSMQYEPFPYPLNNVTANIDYTGGKWVFRDMVGFNDSGRVTGLGEFDPRVEEDALKLRFIATEVPLEAELRDALPPATQNIWHTLQPQGTLDRVVADFRYSPRDRGKHIAVELTQHNAVVDGQSGKLSIRMTELPLRIDRITGTARFEDGLLQFRQVHGFHEGVALSAQGTANVAEDGTWGLNFGHLTVDRARLTSEIIHAMPTAMARLVNRMQLKGAISLDGQFSITGKTGEVQSRQAAWQLLMDVDDASANLGAPCEHVAGQIRLDGHSRGSEFGCRGQLDIDSLMIEGTQVTAIRGPIWLDNDRAVAGTWTNTSGTAQSARPVEARVFGGSVVSNFQVINSDEGTFEAHLRLFDADVSQVAVLRQRQAVNVRGRMWADVNLSGNRQGKHTYQGGGTVNLKDTNLYELPLFLSLLKSMRTGSSDRTAFTTSDAKFRLQGTHVYFDQLDLIGDTLTMKGVGEVNLDRKLNFDFYSVVGREESYFPAIRPLLGMASRRFLLVKVAGTVDDPVMKREVLPGLNDTLKGLFPEEATEPEPRRLVNRDSLPLISRIQKASANVPIDDP